MDEKFESQRAAWLDRYGGPFAQSHRRADVLRRRAREAVRETAGTGPDYQADRIIDAAWARAWVRGRQQPGEFTAWVAVWIMTVICVGPTLLVGRGIYALLERQVPTRRTRMPVTALAAASTVGLVVCACVLRWGIDFAFAWGPWLAAWIVVNVTTIPLATLWFVIAWGWLACQNNPEPIARTRPATLTPQQNSQDEHGTIPFLPTFDDEREPEPLTPPTWPTPPAPLSADPFPPPVELTKPVEQPQVWTPTPPSAPQASTGEPDSKPRRASEPFRPPSSAADSGSFDLPPGPYVSLDPFGDAVFGDDDDRPTKEND